jgi:hypothetical protein
MGTAEDLFARRVDESEVARILQIVSHCPNKRKKPQAGDVSGDFDFWFDGGACRVVTGEWVFELDYGIRVSITSPSPWLEVFIKFPDGRRVSIVQPED